MTKIEHIDPYGWSTFVECLVHERCCGRHYGLFNTKNLSFHFWTIFIFHFFFFSRPVRKYQNKAGEHFNQQVNLI